MCKEEQPMSILSIWLRQAAQSGRHTDGERSFLRKARTGLSLHQGTRQPISNEVLVRALSELISLREKVEQAELKANIYGQSAMRRRGARVTPPDV